LLNFNPAFDNTGWPVNGSTTGFTADEDNISIPPLIGFDFDLEPTTTVNVSEPHTFTVGRAATNLDPSDFDFTATFGSLSLYAGVHIQNCGPAGTCNPTQTGEKSTKVFALTNTTTPVPVPMHLVLRGEQLGPGPRLVPGSRVPGPGVAAPARRARAHGECGNLQPASDGPAVAGAPAVGGRAVAGCDASPQPAARVSDGAIEAVTRPRYARAAAANRPRRGAGDRRGLRGHDR
jgi:hypothetical protein